MARVARSSINERSIGACRSEIRKWKAAEERASLYRYQQAKLTMLKCFNTSETPELLSWRVCVSAVNRRNAFKKSQSQGRLKTERVLSEILNNVQSVTPLPFF